MNTQPLKAILEAAILAAGEPLTLARMSYLFDESAQPTEAELRAALEELAADCADRGVELKELASGFCFQAKVDFAPWVKRLWQEKPPRYTRAFLETLAVIAYRQPITRGEIEDIRGVAVSSNIIKLLLEREWIYVVGQREVPGRPSLYATTRQFLDHFNLKTLGELPALVELQDMDQAAAQLQEQLEATLPQQQNLLAQTMSEDSLASDTVAEESEPKQDNIEDIAALAEEITA